MAHGRTTPWLNILLRLKLPEAGYSSLSMPSSPNDKEGGLQLTSMSTTRATADLSSALDAVLAFARAQGVDQKSLATRAGIRAETITRAKSRRTVEWETVRVLADAAGLDLQVLAMPRRAVDERSSLADPRLKLAWSNPDASTTTLIAKAIERRSFDLILRAAAEHGIDMVASVAQRLREEQAVPPQTLSYADRALRNIAIGAHRALASSH